MNILIIGSGGREHCLAWKISQSKLVDKLFAIPGNAGISQIAVCENISCSKENFGNILQFIEKNGIHLTIVGPEAPLVDGIVDYLSKKGHLVFGPDQTAAQIEGSKVFTKKLCMSHDIPTAKAEFFNKSELDKAISYIKGLKENEFPYVIKADGLAYGKGVIIAQSKEELLDALDGFFIKNRFGKSGQDIVIEEFISGFEVSLLCLCDGKKLIPLDLAQDYKKIFDGDNGKNTGGMGSYSPLPFIDEVLYEKILNKIVLPTFHALKDENINYTGVLYAGIIVRGNEPYLLEYNCRFGDPETQVVLPRLKNDIVPVLLDCARGSLRDIKLKWDDEKTVCVVLASKGYPETSSKGDIISGLEEIKSKKDVFVFHAGTKKDGDKTVTDGGRVLNVVAKADTFKEARILGYEAIERIGFNGMQFRKDIALKVEETL
ncbi:MAG: phosphoribosylamine--glycine ligase [Actinomycetota bacterium]|nr:phosphoribosylamine--glycine ligase [Actinomycetota bacterium]